MAKSGSHLLILLAAFVLNLGFRATSHAEEVDLELVLAMDGSGSISEAEYILQLEGTAAAFRDPSIQRAILSGPIGKIAVSVVIWGRCYFPEIQKRLVCSGLGTIGVNLCVEGSRLSQTYWPKVRHWRWRNRHRRRCAGRRST